MTKANIKEDFSRIIKEEEHLSINIWDIPSVDEMYEIASYIDEVAQSSLNLRSYVNRYSLSYSHIAYESVAAHTNLMMAMVDRALGYHCGSDLFYLEAGRFSYRQIMEAIRLHDLPENIIGDIPDNGSGDTIGKKIAEEAYYKELEQQYPMYEKVFKDKAYILLRDMSKQTSLIGKMLYCADKSSAVLITLQYDKNLLSPRIHFKDESLSERDREEIELCDEQTGGWYKASEMWTIDYLKSRRIVDHDSTGFFTALLIMRTLQVRGKWYKWREKDYL